MKRDHAKDMLPIITAFAQGATIQFSNTNGGWDDVKNLDTAYPVSFYRIKPEPRVVYVATATKHNTIHKEGYQSLVPESSYEMAQSVGELLDSTWHYAKFVEELKD